jgi:hypothetical protein
MTRAHQPALYIASKSDNAALVQMLISAGANVNARADNDH